MTPSPPGPATIEVGTTTTGTLGTTAEVVNSGRRYYITITPLAGGATPVSAHLIITQIG